MVTLEEITAYVEKLEKEVNDYIKSTDWSAKNGNYGHKYYSRSRVLEDIIWNVLRQYKFPIPKFEWCEYRSQICIHDEEWNKFDASKITVKSHTNGSRYRHTDTYYEPTSFKFIDGFAKSIYDTLQYKIKHSEYMMYRTTKFLNKLTQLGISYEQFKELTTEYNNREVKDYCEYIFKNKESK